MGDASRQGTRQPNTLLIAKKQIISLMYLDTVPLALECKQCLTMLFSEATDCDPDAGV